MRQPQFVTCDVCGCQFPAGRGFCAVTFDWRILCYLCATPGKKIVEAVEPDEPTAVVQAVGLADALGAVLDRLGGVTLARTPPVENARQVLAAYRESTRCAP